MRNISFSLTEEAFLDGTKDVTRRLGWKFLKPGDRLRAVRQAMGLKRGEHPMVLGVIEVVSVRQEQLWDISLHPEDCAREGFPHFSPAQFVEFFWRKTGRLPSQLVTRIEFRRIANEERP